MKIKYRILIIDDQLGRVGKTPQKLRKVFCENFNILNATDNENKIDSEIEGHFISAQRIIEKNGKKYLENDIDSVIQKIESHHELDNDSEDSWVWSAILLDLRFSEGEYNIEKDEVKGSSSENDLFGLKIKEAIDKFRLPVGILSEQKEEGKILYETQNQGIVDYISKHGEKKRERLKTFLERFALIEDESKNFIGKSMPTLKMLQDTRRIISEGFDYILMLGETGVGKTKLGEFIADKLGCKYDKRDCQGDNYLAKSLLFGIEKGTATSVEKRKGFLEDVGTGILFLDELGNYSEEIQGLLLNVLQDKKFNRVGGSEMIPFKGKIIFATNKEENIIPDLWHRISENTIRILPLRERKSDIILIANSVIKRIQEKRKIEHQISLTEEAKIYLKNYTFPGNYRELENIIKYIFNEKNVKKIHNYHLEEAFNHFRNDRKSEPHSKDFSTSQLDDNISTITKKGEEVSRKIVLPESIDDLIKILNDFQFSDNVKELKGRYKELSVALQMVLAKYYIKCYEIEKRRDPAFKLMSGNKEDEPSKTETKVDALFTELLTLLDEDEAKFWELVGDSLENHIEIQTGKKKKTVKTRKGKSI